MVAGTGLAAAVLGGQTTTPPGGATTTPSPANDLTILNFALVLEYLEATFYTQGLSKFTSADFAQSSSVNALTSSSGLGTTPPAGDTNTGLAQDVYAYISLIRDHEQQHVRTLRNTITSLGGTAATPPAFKINYSNVDDFLTTAALLETTGVSAYNGALNLVYNPAVVTAGAKIATVEGRHSAYLNRVLGQNPFPNAFDSGKSAADILAVLRPFLGL